MMIISISVLNVKGTKLSVRGDMIKQVFFCDEVLLSWKKDCWLNVNFNYQARIQGDAYFSRTAPHATPHYPRLLLTCSCLHTFHSLPTFLFLSSFIFIRDALLMINPLSEIFCQNRIRKSSISWNDKVGKLFSPIIYTYSHTQIIKSSLLSLDGTPNNLLTSYE